MRTRKGETVGVVDFGSRETRVLIARRDSGGTIQILGHGAEPSRGCISQGVIQDPNAAQAMLKKALTAAEKEAQAKVSSLFCAINGKNVESFVREGNVSLEHEIVEGKHMKEAIDIASRDILAPGKRITSSVTSQEWYVDDLRVTEPLNIRGQVLKTRVHFARIPAVITDNLISCIESQNVTLEDLIFTPLASAQGCLTPEEMELGVAMIDMGRAVTGLAVYRDYRILGTQCFEWGGYHITRDVCAGLHISFEEADDLIMSYGISDELLDAAAENIEELPALPHRDQSMTPIKLKTPVPGAPSIVDRRDVEMIIYARAIELLTKVRQFLHVRNLARNMVCGAVLTGGASEIKNLVELAQIVFQASVRKGMPESIEILPHAARTPSYSAAVGVALHAFAYRTAATTGRIDGECGRSSVMARSLNWMRKYFF